MRYEVRDIVGYEGLYEVDNEGNVFSLNYNHTGERRKLRAGVNGSWGYLRVMLTKDGKKKHHLVHRLVAQAFIENPQGLPQVNHIDEDKTNNRVDNLEFCTAKYNTEYSGVIEKARKAMLKVKSKAVLQYTKQGEFVAEYPSTHEAERQTGIWQTNISKCCLGKSYKSAGGYKWKYKE